MVGPGCARSGLPIEQAAGKRMGLECNIIILKKSIKVRIFESQTSLLTRLSDCIEPIKRIPAIIERTKLPVHRAVLHINPSDLLSN
jgi:hypothetical protein